MKLSVLSDIHADLSRLVAAAPLIAATDVLIVCGDLTRHGDPAELRQVVTELKAIGPAVLAIPGNMDGAGSVAILEEMGVNLHGRTVDRNGIRFIGAGASTPTPFGTPFELEEAEIVALLTGALGTDRPDRLVAVCHNPPHGTALDQAMLGRHVGGKQIRSFVETVRPDVFLCGHIHEAAGTDQLGATRLLNPGPFRRGGVGLVEIPETGDVTLKVVQA